GACQATLLTYEDGPSTSTTELVGPKRGSGRGHREPRRPAEQAIACGPCRNKSSNCYEQHAAQRCSGEDDEPAYGEEESEQRPTQTCLSWTSRKGRAQGEGRAARPGGKVGIPVIISS